MECKKQNAVCQRYFADSEGLHRTAVIQILYFGLHQDVLDRMKKAVLEAAYEKAFQKTPPPVKGKNIYVKGTLYMMNLIFDKAYRA